MYELLIKLYYELDYKKFKLEDLKEIKGDNDNEENNQ